MPSALEAIEFILGRFQIIFGQHDGSSGDVLMLAYYPLENILLMRKVMLAELLPNSLNADAILQHIQMPILAHVFDS
jgi:hypothetical protein